MKMSIKDYTALLPTDSQMHERESQWMALFEKYERKSAPYTTMTEDQLEDVLELVQESDTEENNNDDDDENVPVDLPAEEADVIETDEGVDEALFQEMLTEGKKEIAQRKRLWDVTGESFILDHLSEEMLVEDWVKQNLNESATSNLDISTLYGNMCKKNKQLRLSSTMLETPKAKVTKNVPGSAGDLSPTALKYQQFGSPEKSQRTPLQRSQSATTFNRRQSDPSCRKRPLLGSVRRLTTVQESPYKTNTGNVLPPHKPPKLPRAMSLSNLALPRTRTVIYSPQQPMVMQQFSYLLKQKNFDASKTLVYEPPEGLSSSESDDDIYHKCSRKSKGKIIVLNSRP